MYIHMYYMYAHPTLHRCIYCMYTNVSIHCMYVHDTEHTVHAVPGAHNNS